MSAKTQSDLVRGYAIDHFMLQAKVEDLGAKLEQMPNCERPAFGCRRESRCVACKNIDDVRIEKDQAAHQARYIMSLYRSRRDGGK